jgi:predicted lipoprotein with Yx(FWY)xxD motif
MKRILLALTILASSWTFAAEGDLRTSINEIENLTIMTLEDGREILADGKGFTAYTFDMDEPGVSNCFGRCLVAWPVIATDLDQLPAPFAVHVRPDGVKQITFNDEPIYLYKRDRKVGQIRGDGVGGVWHLIDIK